MSCWKRNDQRPRLTDHQRDSKRPVGVLTEPLIVGDTPKDRNEHLRFYPCRVQERDLKVNWAGFVPECRKETTYQEAFQFRGKDPRRCRTYEFHTNKEKCTFDYCVPLTTAVPFYGKKITDLTLTIPEPKPYLIDEKAPSSWSEYTRTYSKLGGEILTYNLFVRESVRYGETMRKRRNYVAE